MRFLFEIGQQFSRSLYVRHVALYLAANIMAAMVPFLLLPVLTRLMSPEAYGQYSLFLIAVSVTLPLASLMLSSVIAREYTLREPKAFARFFTSCLLLDVAAIGIVLALSWLVRDLFEEVLHLAFSWIALAVVYGTTQGLLSILQGIATMQKKPLLYAYWRSGFAIAIGVVSYGAVILYGGDWRALVSAQALVAAVTLCIAVGVMLRQGWLAGAVSIDDGRMALIYSWPLIVHALTAGAVMQTADRFFVAHHLGLAEAGSYNVAQQFSMAMYLIVSVITLVWTPWYYEQMKKNDDHAKRRIVQLTYFGFFVLAAMGAAMAMALWIIFPYFIGAAFAEARPIFPWLILGFVFNGMYVMIASGMFYTGHTVQLMLCNIGTAAVNILLNSWLVPRYGMIGAASATVSSTLFMFLCVWAITARLHRLPWLLRQPA